MDTNAAKPITDLWQRYSPTAWSEMYNEYVKYAARMTEIYQEYAKSSERMTELYKELAMNAEKMTELYKESAKRTEKMSKYWLNLTFWIKPLSENKEKNEKQE
jgi:NAD(P)H-nitrite reductase large subunit